MDSRTFQFKWALTPDGAGFRELDANQRHARIQETNEVLVGQLNAAALAMSANLTVEVDGEAAVDLDPVKSALIDRAAQLANSGGPAWGSFSLLFHTIVDDWSWVPGPPPRIECTHAVPTSIKLSAPGHSEIEMRVCLIASCKDCELETPSGFSK